MNLFWILLQDVNMYFVSSLFSVRSASLLSFDRAWLSGHLQFLLISFTFLMTYSKAKFKSSGNKTYPCFGPFWKWNASDSCLPTWTLLYFLGLSFKIL
jgi:hypothetical protein